MSYNRVDGVISRTRAFAHKKLQKLLVETVEEHIAPTFEKQAALEDERIRIVLTAAGLADPQYADWIQRIPTKSAIELEYKMGESSFSSTLTIRHAEVSHRPMESMKLATTGDFSWAENKLVAVRHVEEIVNVFLMFQAVACELEPWTEQFQGKKTTDRWGREKAASWDEDKLSRMCAFSPLYRANLALRNQEEVELRAYKHGPRASNMKFMSPQLVKALTTTAHLPEVEG